MLAHSIKSQTGKSVLLFPFNYLGHRVAPVSLHVLTHYAAAERGQNDKNNKMREAIIGAIINDCVPATYYRTERWSALKTAVDGFLHECAGARYSRVECIHAAGRGHNYDFTVKFFADGGGQSCNNPTARRPSRLQYCFMCQKPREITLRVRNTIG